MQTPREYGYLPATRSYFNIFGWEVQTTDLLDSLFYESTATSGEGAPLHSEMTKNEKTDFPVLKSAVFSVY